MRLTLRYVDLSPFLFLGHLQAKKAAKEAFVAYQESPKVIKGAINCLEVQEKARGAAEQLFKSSWIPDKYFPSRVPKSMLLSLSVGSMVMVEHRDRASWPSGRRTNTPISLVAWLLSTQEEYVCLSGRVCYFWFWFMFFMLFMVIIISSTCRKLYVALSKKPIISSTCRKLYVALNRKP